MTYTDMPLAELLAGTSRAKAVYPLERLRIEKGLGLCLHEAVELRIDGTALVHSATEPETTYTVQHGRCTCPDSRSKAPAGRCKHRWGVALLRKAIKTTMIGV